MQTIQIQKPRIAGRSCGNCGACGECTQDRVILPVGIVAKEITETGLLTIGGYDRKVISYKVRNASCNCILQIIIDNIIVEELLPGQQFADAVDSHFYFDQEIKMKFLEDTTLNPNEQIVCKAIISERIIKC